MHARFTISGGDRLTATIVAKTKRLSDLEPLLAIAGAVERDAATLRFLDEGRDLSPPWQPSKKTIGGSVTVRNRQRILGVDVLPGETIEFSGYGKTGVDTRTLVNSIEYHVTSPTHVRIGTNVVYARYFQQGTGIYYDGNTGWTIAPKTRRVLSWNFGGVKFFAREVHTLGQPPRPFLFFSDRDVEVILGQWATMLRVA